MDAIISAARRDPVIYELDGMKLEITMSLNAIAEIQKQYGEMGEALDRAALSEDGVEILIGIMTILINEAIEGHNEDCPGDPWQPYTKRRLGRRLGMNDINDLRRLLVAVMTGSLPAADVTGEVTPELAEILDGVQVEEPPADAKN